MDVRPGNIALDPTLKYFKILNFGTAVDKREFFKADVLINNGGVPLKGIFLLHKEDVLNLGMVIASLLVDNFFAYDKE